MDGLKLCYSCVAHKLFSSLVNGWEECCTGCLPQGHYLELSGPPDAPEWHRVQWSMPQLVLAGKVQELVL
ncbi:hypothetical protein E2C01_021491 [Portunus trituberculatus]|uniref:Uncharacterized protein n=1 Tax=Portunus trituberculatus TaxID=210409 RepID=A0A5B7E2U9_PORTR|nr:hypothetical protein [Portunus trituberculatus]